jgi:hypothetical protein
MRRLGERKATCVVTLETWNYHGQVRIMAVSGLPFLSFFANTSVLVLKTLHPPCARAKLKWSCPASTLDWTRRDVAREELRGKRGKRQERQKAKGKESFSIIQNARKAVTSRYDQTWQLRPNEESVQSGG